MRIFYIATVYIFSLSLVSEAADIKNPGGMEQFSTQLISQGFPRCRRVRVSNRYAKKSSIGPIFSSAEVSIGEKKKVKCEPLRRKGAEILLVLDKLNQEGYPQFYADAQYRYYGKDWVLFAKGLKEFLPSEIQEIRYAQIQDFCLWAGEYDYMKKAFLALLCKNSKLSNLRVLYNKIPIIPQGTFLGMQPGCHLWWNNNQTTTIERGAFTYVDNGKLEIYDNVDDQSKKNVLKDTEPSRFWDRFCVMFGLKQITQVKFCKKPATQPCNTTCTHCRYR